MYDGMDFEVHVQVCICLYSVPTEGVLRRKNSYHVHSVSVVRGVVRILSNKCFHFICM